MKIYFYFMLIFSFSVLADCDNGDSSFSCFIGSAPNPVYLGSDGLYHTDYYCSDMASSYYSENDKGKLSGEWHYVGPSKTPSCDFYRDSNKLAIQSQIEHCIYWTEHNMEIPERYHCDKILKK